MTKFSISGQIIYAWWPRGFFFFQSFDINNLAKLSKKLVKFKLGKPIFPNIPKEIAKKMAKFAQKIHWSGHYPKWTNK